jgi:hypothetical protein
MIIIIDLHIIFFACKAKYNCQINSVDSIHVILKGRGRRGHDRMVVGFTTTYAISAHHH